ncbi:hypothetical protein [Haloprofundus halobius]|uniref:hypothetical protein n=1 Tax=Haloprofundus halobius TaxID=2876194 RepID=UPI001CCDF036|nr:hypothetical protein [Haloprofundus halobius]
MTRQNQTRRRFLAGSAATLGSLSVLTGGAGARTSTRILAVVNATGDGPAKYRFSVDGDVEKTTETGGAPNGFASLNDDDRLTETTAEGRVHGGADAYRISGSLTSLVVEGGAGVYVDGEEIDAGDYPSPSVLAMTGDGEYTFSADGSVAKTILTGGADVPPASLNDADTVDGTDVSGSTFGGTDAYVVDGELTEFDPADGLTAFLDGEEYTGPSDGRGETGGTDDADDTGGDEDDGGETAAPELSFPDCTTVEISGSFEAASLEVLVEDDDPETTPMEQVYEYENDDGATEATVSVPADEFGPYQVVEYAIVTYGDGRTVEATNPDAGACRDETFPATEPTVEFPDCTTVEISGSFEAASLEVLVEDDDPETTPMEQVYEYEHDGESEDATVSVPDDEFGPYQVVEYATVTYDDGRTVEATNPDAGACRDETFPVERSLEFVDCTTVHVAGAFDDLSIEVLVRDDMPTTPMEQVYEHEGDGESEETTVSVPDGEFGPYQVAERATVVYPDGEVVEATNPDAGTCRDETFPE